MSVDPRDDPRAHDLLRADPGVVSSLASVFADVASEAQATADGLRGADQDATWSGAAAEAFRQGLGKLPGDLDKVTSSYHEAAGALNRYEGEVSSLKSAFQSIASQLDGAHAQLASAQSQLAGAQSALGAAQAKAAASTQSPLIANPLLPPVARTVPLTSPLYTNINAASGAVQNAQGEISALSSRGFALLDEFDSARRAAAATISSASHVPPHRSFWDSVFHDVGSFLSDAGHFLVGIGSHILDSVTGTIGAFENFVADPTLANFGRLAGDVAVDASIVALAAAAPEALGLVGVAEGAGAGAAEESIGLAARLASIGGPAQTVGTLAGAAKADSELLRGQYANAGIDALFAALPNGDNLAGVLGVGEKGAEAAASTAEALQTYQFFIDHGFTPTEALGMLSDGETWSVLDHVPNLNDPGPATSSAVTAAARAAKNAGRIGAPIAFSADSIKDRVGDITKEKVGAMLHPEPSTNTCP